MGLKFASPGAERQDSVESGFNAIDAGALLVAIHDSARPLVTPADAARCFEDALAVGAAVLGVPVKPTIKEADAAGRVTKTLQRAKLWEVQTPQVRRRRGWGRAWRGDTTHGRPPPVLLPTLLREMEWLLLPLLTLDRCRPP